MTQDGLPHSDFRGPETLLAADLIGQPDQRRT